MKIYDLSLSIHGFNLKGEHLCFSWENMKFMEFASYDSMDVSTYCFEVLLVTYNLQTCEFVTSETIVIHCWSTPTPVQIPFFKCKIKYIQTYSLSNSNGQFFHANLFLLWNYSKIQRLYFKTINLLMP